MGTERYSIDLRLTFASYLYKYRGLLALTDLYFLATFLSSYLKTGAIFDNLRFYENFIAIFSSFYIC